MQVPKRKGGKFTYIKPDPHMTEEKFNDLKKNLEELKVVQPKLAAEVHRLAQLGDLSENAGYQIAKGKLRGVNQKILELEDQVHKAVIIKPQSSHTVQIGSKVVVEIHGEEKTYTILGSSETDPFRGIISHSSPIGSILLGHRAGEIVNLKIKDSETRIRIIEVK